MTSSGLQSQIDEFPIDSISGISDSNTIEENQPERSKMNATEPASNLYAQMCQSGLFIAVSSVVGIWVVAFSSASEFADAAVQALGSADQQDFWEKHLAVINSNAAYSFYFLCTTFPIGITLMLVGAYFWYHRVQKFNDLKLKMETEKLQDSSKKEPERPKLFIA